MWVGSFVTQEERVLASGRLGWGAGRRREDTVDWAGEREGCAGAGGPGVGCVGCGFGGVPVRGWPQGYRKVLSASSNEANLSEKTSLGHPKPTFHEQCRESEPFATPESFIFSLKSGVNQHF